MIRTGNCGIEHQDIWDAVDGFSSCNGLIPLASSAPSLRSRLSLHAALKNLGESGARNFVVSTWCFLENCVRKSRLGELRLFNLQEVDKANRLHMSTQVGYTRFCNSYI